MCGIFGYYHFKVSKPRSEIVSLLLNGLKKLEYRGYDSVGISYDDASGIMVKKSVGKTETLRNSLANVSPDPIDCSLAIGHTRWATHGDVSERNAHPHVSDPKHTFVCVHNGVITNSTSLRQMLVNAGHRFVSETDTEVIPKLFMHFYTPGTAFSDVARLVCSHLEGTYAFIVKSAQFPRELVACMKGSPLIIGVHQDDTDDRLELFMSSDTPALVDHTQDIIVLDDGDIFHVADGVLSFYNKDSVLSKPITRMDMEVASVSKGAYQHYMVKEIHEQLPIMVQNVLRHVKGGGIQFEGMAQHVNRILRSSRIVLIACGSSYYSCLATKHMIEKSFGIPVETWVSSYVVDCNPLLLSSDTCIFVSQSGETADTLHAMNCAQHQGSFCIGVTNAPYSAIARRSSFHINVHAGTEVGVASTKAYTSQITALIMFAMAVAGHGSIPEHLQKAFVQLPRLVERTLELEREIINLAGSIKDEYNMFFIGRGADYATAHEAALKVKEVAYVHSEAVLAGELKHGPLALIDEKILSFVICPLNDLHDKNISTVEQLRARKGRVIILCNEEDKKIALVAPNVALIRVPYTCEELQPIINIIPFQLLAYHLALQNGHNVDQPRNLAKSVTVMD